MPDTSNIDWNATAAWIALAVAIISPIITTIIANCHQSEMKRLEIMEKRGLDIIENYISITSKEKQSDLVSYIQEHESEIRRILRHDHYMLPGRLYPVTASAIYNHYRLIQDTCSCQCASSSDTKDLVASCIHISRMVPAGEMFRDGTTTYIGANKNYHVS